MHSAHLRSVTGCTLQWPMGTYDTVPRALGGHLQLLKLLQWSNSGYWVSSPIVAIKYCQVGQYCNASILLCSALEVWHQPLHFWWSAAMGGILGRCIGTSIIFHFLLMLSSVSIVIEEEIQTNKKNGDRQRCNIVMRF